MKIIYTSKMQEIFVDDEDYETLNKYNWYCTSQGYAKRSRKAFENKGKTSIFMHRQIMDAPEGMFVDHINHDKLDNQKKNLRLCTKHENCMNGSLRENNTSGVVGVCWNKKNNIWIVRISINKKRTYIGSFDSLDDAIKARKDAEEKYYKDFQNKEMKITDEKLREGYEKEALGKIVMAQHPRNKTSGIQGVSFNTRHQKWYANIRINGKTTYTGCYLTLEEAKQARKEAELKYYGKIGEDANIEQCQ